MTKSMMEFNKSVKAILTGSYDSIHIVSGTEEMSKTLSDVSYVEIQRGSNEGFFVNAKDRDQKEIFFIRINTGNMSDALTVLNDITTACL